MLGTLLSTWPPATTYSHSSTTTRLSIPLGSSNFTALLVEYCADATTGPVVRVLPDGTPEWVGAGGFFNQPLSPPARPDPPPTRATRWSAFPHSTNEVSLRRDFPPPWRLGQLAVPPTPQFRRAHCLGSKRDCDRASRGVEPRSLACQARLLGWLCPHPESPGPSSRLAECLRRNSACRVASGRWRRVALESAFLGIPEAESQAQAVKAAMRVASALGTAHALIGGRFDEYRRVDG